MEHKNIEIGAWNKLPHYCVVGEPSYFYVYKRIQINDRSAESWNSNWISGELDLYHRLKQIKNKIDFMIAIDNIMIDFGYVNM